MILKERILELESKWLKDNIEPATHIGLSMITHIRLKEQYFEELGYGLEESVVMPFVHYEGLKVVVSEDPEAEEITLLRCGH